jgi:glucokinase
MRELKKGAASSLPGDAHISAKDVAIAARQGDPLALAAFEQAARWLGLGLANYLHIFNPSAIILGGGVSQSLNLMQDTLWSVLRANLMTPHYLDRLTIVQAALGDDAGLVGASVLAHSVVKS